MVPALGTWFFIRDELCCKREPPFSDAMIREFPGWTVRRTAMDFIKLSSGVRTRYPARKVHTVFPSVIAVHIKLSRLRNILRIKVFTLFVRFLTFWDGFYTVSTYLAKNKHESCGSHS